MKIKIIILVCAVFSLFSCSSGDNKTEYTDKEIGVFFGDPVLSVIKGADSAITYKIKSEKVAVLIGKSLHGYPVIHEISALTDSQLSMLKDVLLDVKTYNFSWARKSPVIPEYAIVFKKGGEEVIVLIDLIRKEFLFVYKGKELIEGFDKSEKRVRTLIDEIFKIE